MVFNIVGMLGLVSYLVTYFYVQQGKLDSDSLKYASANLCSACMILFSLLGHFNLAATLLVLIWMAMCGIEVFRHIMRMRQRKQRLRGAHPYPSHPSRRVDLDYHIG